MRISLRRQAEPEPRPQNCLNCGVAVPPESVYCGQCGQENEASPVSFAALVREVWEEFVKVDKKLLATLSALLVRPGYLTAEYVRGRRVAYLSPFRMYITVSALFFLVCGLVVPFEGVNSLNRNSVSVGKEIGQEAKDVAKQEVDKISVSRQEMKAARNDKKDAVQKGATTQQPPKPGRLKEALSNITSNSDTSKNDPPSLWQELRRSNWTLLGNRIALQSLPKSVREYRTMQARLPIDKRDRPILHYSKERLIRFINDPAGSAKSLFSAGLPFLLLIQLPLFAIWMRVIYFRQRRLYVEHLVFILHTHTFFFLLFGAILAANAVALSLGMNIPMLDIPLTWLLLTGIVTLYNLIAYRRFYGQGWGRTLVKCWFLLNGYLFLLMFTFTISALFAVVWTVFATL